MTDYYWYTNNGDSGRYSWGPYGSYGYQYYNGGDFYYWDSWGNSEYVEKKGRYGSLTHYGETVYWNVDGCWEEKNETAAGYYSYTTSYNSNYYYYCADGSKFCPEISYAALYGYYYPKDLSYCAKSYYYSSGEGFS